MEKILTIKNNTVFGQVYAKGKSSVQPSIVVYCRKRASLPKAHVGITAGKKLGGAVERNRARRIIKEAYRNLVLEGTGINDKPYYYVFVARKKCFVKKTRMQDVLSDMRKALRDLGLLGESL